VVIVGDNLIVTEKRCVPDNETRLYTNADKLYFFRMPHDYTYATSTCTISYKTENS